MPFLKRRPKFGRVTLTLGIFALLAPACARAQNPTDPQVDCADAFRPYSTSIPLVDLLLNPAAKAVVERDAPGYLGKLPAMFSQTTAPTFGAIITIRFIGTEFIPAPDGVLDKLDRDLAAVPVKREDAVARCARYDHTAPEVPATLEHPAILIFSKSNGFRDSPSVNAALAALKTIAAEAKWHPFLTENAAVFNAEDLKRFDAVVWNNVSGDVLTLPQRAAFKDYIERGGGFAGVHGSGGDPYCDWDWYADRLIGARFKGHPLSPQFQDAQLRVDDPTDSIVRGLPAQWTMKDEWYSFRSNPREGGAHVLLTLNENTYTPEFRGKSLRMGDHPIAWTQCLGSGRSFYSAIGHVPEAYSDPNVHKLMMQGIAWAAGVKSGACAIQTDH